MAARAIQSCCPMPAIQAGFTIQGGASVRLSANCSDTQFLRRGGKTWLWPAAQKDPAQLALNKTTRLKCQQRGAKAPCAQERKLEKDFRHDTSTSIVPTVDIPWAAGSLFANGVKISYHYTALPQAMPVLVFLHGLSSAGPVLIPLLSELASSFQIFLPSARGHGESQPMPVGSFTMDNLVEDAVAAIQHFSPGKKVFLAGHSMGAATAARVAKKVPELISAAVLEDPPWLRLEGNPVIPNHTTPNPFPGSRALKAMAEQDFLKLNSQHVSAKMPPLAFTQRESERRFDADGIEPTFRATDDEINEAVEDILVPTLLQTGGGPQAVCSEEVAQRTLATWPKGERSHYPGANHLIHAPPRTEEWLDDVRRFLEQHV